MAATITPRSSANDERTSVILLRISSVLLAGIMLGHASAYPWSSSRVSEEIALTESMKSTPFVFAGERSSYWSLYMGWGVLVAVTLLTLAAIVWLLSDLAPIASRSVGAISAVFAAFSLVAAYISLRFFYVPPTVLYVVLSAILTTVAARLLRRANP